MVANWQLDVRTSFNEGARAVDTLNRTAFLWILYGGSVTRPHPAAWRNARGPNANSALGPELRQFAFERHAEIFVGGFRVKCEFQNRLLRALSLERE